MDLPGSNRKFWPVRGDPNDSPDNAGTRTHWLPQRPLIAARTLSSLSRWRAEGLPWRFSPLCAGYDQRGDCIKESSSLVRLAQMGPPAFGIGGRYNACLLHAAHVTTQEKL